ncbi:MAG: Ig-like domain-containing protein [Reichenbachiella sp.]|uniref:Ig-like domain-containing protein n=1 Tax=Reichenbachiella sp. TaxID=2184521 RepID=UPI00329A15CE
MKRTITFLLTLLFSIAFAGYSTAQSITITSPADGATVGSSFDVTADAVGTYTKVRIKLDGVTQIDLDDTTAPYSFSLTGVSDGTHEIKVYGKDTPSGTWHNQVINVNVVSSTPVTGVSVSPSSASIEVGATTALTETVSPSNATDKTVTWSSSNAAVATVNASGTVTGVSVGSATITVTTNDGSNTATSNITVTGGGSGDPSVTITSPSDGATVGSSFEVTADAVGTYTRLRIKIDDDLQSELDDSTAPYSFSLAGISEGSHTIKVYGKDTGSGSWKNQVINITVDANNGGGSPGGSCPTCPIRVGDPGVTFGPVDPNYQEGMTEWRTAGVEGGIPFRSTSAVAQTISATNTAGIQAAIDAASASSGGSVVQVVLQNGIYDIDSELKLKSNVRLVGESQAGVILNISMTGDTGAAITFGVTMAGIENLTVQGGHGQPNDFTMTNAKTNFQVTSIYGGGGTRNCWIDGVKIINSGNHGIDLFNSDHVTIRDCYVERSWNKGEGGRGYVQINARHTLVFNTTIKKMRHFAVQKQHAKYNVFYRNNLEQDINFHDGDQGFNLAEKNVIRLPAGLASDWHAVMGKWSTQHQNPGPNNVVYGNDGIENNNGGISSFCDPTKVWVPKGDERDPGGAFSTNTNTPSGGSFYPVSNAVDDGATPRSECSTGGTPPPAGECEADSGPGNIFNDDFNCPNWSSNYELTTADDPEVNGNDVTHMTTGGYNDSPCIRVKISEGSHYGCDFRYRTDVSEAYAQYKVFYETGFAGTGIGNETGENGYWGKSPGWDGTRRSCGWGKCIPTDEQPGWSARGSLDRANGKVKNKKYVYHADMELPFGDSWYWDGPAMNDNQWYTVDEYIKVNTPGVANGEMRVWLDGTLVFQKTDINFTNVGGEFAKIEGWWFNYYYGGEPVSDNDFFVRLDDFRLSTSPIGPSGSGTACIGSQCSQATMTSPVEGANLEFPFNVTGSVSPGYRMSVVMLNSNGETAKDKVWVGGTTGSNNSGTFECTEQPNVKTGATKLEFYGVDDDGNGDGFAYFTAPIIIDVTIGDEEPTPPQTETATNNGITMTYPANPGSDFTVTANSETSFDSWSIKVDSVWAAGSGSGTSATFNLTGIAGGSHTIFVYAKQGAVWTDGPTVSVTVGSGARTRDSQESNNELSEVNKGLLLYPNPTAGIATLQLGNDHNYHSLQIVDLGGKTLIQKPVRATDFKIEMDLNRLSIPKGMYTIQLVAPDRIDTRKLIKN